MGNQQYCCNYKPADPHAQEFNQNGKTLAKPKGIKKLEIENVDKLMKDAKKNEQKIINSQEK